jgi:hypothetical protein
MKNPPGFTSYIYKEEGQAKIRMSVGHDTPYQHKTGTHTHRMSRSRLGRPPEISKQCFRCRAYGHAQKDDVQSRRAVCSCLSRLTVFGHGAFPPSPHLNRPRQHRTAQGAPAPSHARTSDACGADEVAEKTFLFSFSKPRLRTRASALK